MSISLIFSIHWLFSPHYFPPPVVHYIRIAIRDSLGTEF